MADELYPVESGSSDLDFGATIRGFCPTQRVFNRYLLMEVVGRGGMGVVWKARDGKLNRDVALKFLPELVTLDKEAIGELKRETKHSLDLTHPNIVRIYDFVQDQTSAAISMEFVDGWTLSSLKAEQPHGCMEADALGPLIAQLCDALTYAHTRAQVVHRDLKPANLMLTQRYELKLADLGIARSVSDSVSRVTMKGGTSGTLLYMSPQQAMGQPPMVSDDIYALGATIYDLLSSKAPFYTGDVVSQLREVVPPSITERRQQLRIEGQPIPPEWEATIAACLDKIAANRPKSAAEVSWRLGLGPEPVAAPATGALTAGGPRTNLGGTPPSARTATAAGTNPPTAPTARTVQFTLPPPPSKSMLLVIAAVVGLLVVMGGGLGYYFGVMVPAQKAREAEEARVQAEKLQQQMAAQAAADAATREKEQERQAKAASDAAAAKTAQDARDAAAAHLAAARGGMMVKTNPPGATVTLGGEAVMTSPANFQAVKLGKYPVTVRLDGFEPMDTTVEITENQFVDLGTLNLVRSTGSVQILATPDGATYELKPATVLPGSAGGVQPDLKGTTPATVDAVPTGNWILTLTAPGYDTSISQIQVMRNQPTKFTKDFIVDRATVGVPDAVKALLVTPDANGLKALDDAGKKQFTDAAATLFAAYVKANLFRKAKELDTAMTQAGMTDATRAAGLATAEQAWVTTNQPIFEGYVKSQNFAAAKPMLDQQPELSDPTLMASWKTDYDTAYAAFQAAIQPDLDALKQLLANQSWADAETKVATDEKSYPTQPDFFQYGLQIDKALPNTLDRLQSRIARMELFLNQNLLPTDQAVSVKSDLAGFTALITKHKTLAGAVDAVESEIKHQNSQIASLESKRKSEEDMKGKYDTGNAAAGFLQSIPGMNFTQKGSSDHQANINAINSKISSLNSEVDSEQSQLENARAAYSAFTSETIGQALATRGTP